jgi:hypothetical protein
MIVMPERAIVSKEKNPNPKDRERSKLSRY